MAGQFQARAGPPRKCQVRYIKPKYMWEHDLEPCLPLTGTYPGLRGPKIVFYVFKLHNGALWCTVSSVRQLPGNCLMRHITQACESITQGHSGPFLGLLGSKNGYLFCKNTWKVSNALHCPQIQSRIWPKDIFTFPRQGEGGIVIK